MMGSGIDVVCVAYGAVDGLQRSLSAALLGSRAGPPDLVVVVDHGAPGADQIARSTGATLVVDHENPGFGAGQNRGVALGQAEFVLLLNPDFILRPGALDAGVDVLRANPDAALVQGVIINEATGSPERSQGIDLGVVHLWGRATGAKALLDKRFVRRWARRGVLADHVDRAPRATSEVEQLAATAVLARRRAFEEVGGFDPGYFLYGEDLDLCRRLRAAGWALIALPTPWGSHESGASSSGWLTREVAWWEGTMRFAAQWWSGLDFTLGMVAACLRAGWLRVRFPRSREAVLRRVVVYPLTQRARRRRTEVGLFDQ